MHLVLSVCQESPRCFKEGVCGGDGVCSLPGRRAGHASSSFFYQGGPSVLILYGGEIHKNETSTERQLTNDIVTGWFDGSSITWARMNLDCPLSWSCPEPRRDMSISIIDSRGDSRLRICVCVLKIYKFQSVRVCKRQNLESNDHLDNCAHKMRSHVCGTTILAQCPTATAGFLETVHSTSQKFLSAQVIR